MEIGIESQKKISGKSASGKSHLRVTGVSEEKLGELETEIRSFKETVKQFVALKVE
jgi:hypothetical protein